MWHKSWIFLYIFRAEFANACLELCSADRWKAGFCRTEAEQRVMNCRASPAASSIAQLLRTCTLNTVSELSKPENRWWWHHLCFPGCHDNKKEWIQKKLLLKLPLLVIFPWVVCLVFVPMFTRSLKHLGYSSSSSLLHPDGNRNAPFSSVPWSICRLGNSLFYRWFVEFTACLPWFVPLSIPAQETWMCAWGLACARKSRTSCGKGRDMLLLLWRRFFTWRRIWKSTRQANTVPGSNSSPGIRAWLTNWNHK